MRLKPAAGAATAGTAVAAVVAYLQRLRAGAAGAVVVGEEVCSQIFQVAAGRGGVAVSAHLPVCKETRLRPKGRCFGPDSKRS